MLNETLHIFLYAQWAWEYLRYFIDIDFLIKDFRSKQLRERTNERWCDNDLHLTFRFALCQRINCATLKRVKRFNSCQHHILILTLCHLQMFLCKPTINQKKYSSSKHLTIPTIHLLRPTCLLIRAEVNAHAIHTMSRVRRCTELFPHKNMSQVAPAICTHYLRP